MKHSWKKKTAVMLTAAICVAVTACANETGKSDGERVQEVAESEDKTTKETTLKVFLFGQAQNMDKVLEVFYEQTKSTLNTKLDITWNDSKTYREKLPLMMANQEEADLVFDAPWMSLTKMKNQGAYASLNEYFNNDKYLGLKKAFSQEDLEEITDPDGNIYSVPFKQSSIDIPCYLIRKDLREKYEMEPIQSNEDLEAYMKNIQADIDAGIVDMIAPLGISGSRSFYYLDSDIIEKANNNVYEISGTSPAGVGMEMEVALSEDGKTVLGAATLGDPDSAYESFPAPYNKNTRSERAVTALTKWAKYTQPDPQTESDARVNLFYTGKVAVCDGNLSNYTQAKEAIQKLGGEVECYFYLDEIREQKLFVSYIALTANNFLCVPVQSKQKDEAMKFLDWIFLSQENHDLFELGIEGEDWKAVGTDEYEQLQSNAGYAFPGYELTWNPNYIRVDSSLPEEVKSYVKYQNNTETFLQNKLLGFQFNADATPELNMAIASVSAVQSEYHRILMMGLMKSPEEAQKTLDEYYGKIKSAGIDVIREEVIRQLQEHLDNKYN